MPFLRSRSRMPATAVSIVTTRTENPAARARSIAGWLDTKCRANRSPNSSTCPTPCSAYARVTRMLLSGRYICLFWMSPFARRPNACGGR